MEKSTTQVSFDWDQLKEPEPELELNRKNSFPLFRNTMQAPINASYNDLFSFSHYEPSTYRGMMPQMHKANKNVLDTKDTITQHLENKRLKKEKDELIAKRPPDFKKIKALKGPEMLQPLLRNTDHDLKRATYKLH